MKKRLLAGIMAGLMLLSQSTVSFGFEKHDKNETKKTSGTVNAANINTPILVAAEGNIDGSTMNNAIEFTNSSTSVSFSDYPFKIYRFKPTTTGDYEIKSSNPRSTTDDDDDDETDPKMLLLDQGGKITRIMDEAYSPAESEESYSDLNFDIIVPCTAGTDVYFAVTTYGYFPDYCDDKYQNIGNVFSGEHENEWDQSASYTVTISKAASHAHGVDYNGTKTTVQVENCGRVGIYSYVCGICGRAVRDTVPATGDHEWDSGRVTTAPTETVKGVKTFTCSVCGSKKTASIPATGVHSWNGGVVTVQPTEESAGVKTYTCSGCGSTRTEAIPPIIIPQTVARTVKALKAKAKKTKVTVSWKKLSKKDLKKLKNVSGIDVQVSTDPAFTNKIVNKTIGKKKAKFTFTGKKKTTYWVRVRYHASSGVSAWKNKAVKVK